MKKLLSLALVSMIALPLVADEEDVKVVRATEQTETEKNEVRDVWPAYLAICQWPRTADVVGLRLTIPFSTAQENVTGLDLGLWGQSTYFEGIQVNILRNDVIDGGAGFQIGLYNSVGSGELLGIQVGLWNEAMSFGGLQVGLINVVGEGRGFQVGLVNRADTLSGYQVGLINVIRDAELRFFPLINIGF